MAGSFMAKLEEASTHKSAMTNAGNVLRASWPWPFDPEINEFPAIMMDHVYVKFVDPNCIGFLRYCVKKPTNIQTDRQTQMPLNTPPTWLLSVWVNIVVMWRLSISKSQFLGHQTESISRLFGASMTWFRYFITLKGPAIDTGNHRMGFTLPRVWRSLYLRKSDHAKCRRVYTFNSE